LWSIPQVRARELEHEHCALWELMSSAGKHCILPVRVRPKHWVDVPT
jgi:hypothetical protein